MSDRTARSAIPRLQPGTQHGGPIGIPVELEEHWLNVVRVTERRLSEQSDGPMEEACESGR